MLIPQGQGCSSRQQVILSTWAAALLLEQVYGHCLCEVRLLLLLLILHLFDHDAVAVAVAHKAIPRRR